MTAGETHVIVRVSEIHSCNCGDKKEEDDEDDEDDEDEMN